MSNSHSTAWILDCLKISTKQINLLSFKSVFHEFSGHEQNAHKFFLECIMNDINIMSNRILSPHLKPHEQSWKEYKLEEVYKHCSMTWQCYTSIFTYIMLVALSAEQQVPIDFRVSAHKHARSDKCILVQALRDSVAEYLLLLVVFTCLLLLFFSDTLLSVNGCGLLWMCYNYPIEISRSIGHFYLRMIIKIVSS